MKNVVNLVKNIAAAFTANAVKLKLALIDIMVTHQVIEDVVNTIAPGWLDAVVNNACKANQGAYRGDMVLEQINDPDSMIVWRTEPLLSVDGSIQTCSFVVALGDQFVPALVTDIMSPDGSEIVHQEVSVGDFAMPEFELAREAAMNNEAGLQSYSMI